MRFKTRTFERGKPRPSIHALLCVIDQAIGHILYLLIFCPTCLCKGTNGGDDFRGEDIIRETIRLNQLDKRSFSGEGSNTRRLRRCHHREVALRMCLHGSAGP